MSFNRPRVAAVAVVVSTAGPGGRASDIGPGAGGPGRVSFPRWGKTWLNFGPRWGMMGYALGHGVRGSHEEAG